MSAVTDDSSVGRHHHPSLARSVNESAAFGQFLRSARERRGLSLEQISRETKIPHRHLVSLENGDLSVIPGSTYRRGEVVAYAQVVGLDHAVALAELARVLQAPLSGDAPTPMPSRSRLPHVALGLVGALSAVTLGVGVWKQEFPQVQSVLPPQSVTAAQHQAPATRASADAAPASQASAASQATALHAAAASSTPAAANPQRQVNAGPLSPPEEVDSSAALTPNSAISTQTSLVIITQPAGARVTVDDIGWGTTPVTIRNLPAGTKRIRVTKEGYAAAVRVANVPEQRRVTINVPLRSVKTLPKR